VSSWATFEAKHTEYCNVDSQEDKVREMQDNISIYVFDLTHTTLQSLQIDREACIYDVLLTEPQNYVGISQSGMWS
jgi:Na+/phosphate symporter